MKAFITRLARVMPEGRYYKALKAEAEVVEGNTNSLLWDLAVHRYALQRVINALWELDKLPRKSQVHQMFYSLLRSYGFRAHVARNIYTTALTLVKSAKKNDSSRPTVKRMSVRLDYQDARVDIDNHVVKVNIRGKWYTLKLRHRREYIEKFEELRWKAVHLKYWRGRLTVSIIFEARYNPYVPRGVIALGINLKQVVAFDGSSTRRYKTRFVDALGKRARAEEMQKKYPRRWKYNRRILHRLRSLHIRARDIVTADRDVVGAMNIWSRVLHAYAGMPGSSQSAPTMNNETRESGRTIDEGMKQTIKNT